MGKEIVLRDYQLDAVEKLRDNIRSKIKNQILCIATGGGKTVIAAHLLQESSNKKRRAIFVCDRISLINQTSKTLDDYDIPHGVMQAQHWRFKPWERVQVCSAATLARREWPETDLILVDECFPGDTLISTPNGNVRIDTLKHGELIYNAVGVAEIASTFEARRTDFVIVRLSNGEKFECTPDHPIFTDMGWRPAGALVVGQKLFCNDSVRALWRGNDSAQAAEAEREIRSGGGNTVQQEDVLRSILREEIKEPNAFEGDSGQDERNTKANWTQASYQGREWIPSAGATSKGERDAWRRVGNGDDRKNTEVIKAGISSPLQTGLGQQGVDDLHRVGREESLLAETTGARQEEGRPTEVIRVESVENIKREGGQLVYNLRVNGHPSYFANGILVHNCHAQIAHTIKRISQRDVVTIGLSATPFSKGLGKHYDAVVNVTTTNKLMTENFLVPFRVFAAKEPDMTGAKVVAGEWTENEIESRTIPIIGDCVAEYLKHCSGKKFIAFGVNVAHATEMKKQFADAGVVCELYTYREGDELRTETVDEFRKPDSYIRGLISVSALSKGFDCTDVEVIIMCRPLKSSLAEHIQILGRGLRIHEGKTECIVLDLAGNMMRFWSEMSNFFETGEVELDDGKKKEKKKPKPREKKPVKCPVCFHIHEAFICPSCGHVPAQRSGIDQLAGELSEMNLSAGVSRDTKQEFYSQLLSYAKERGYDDGWVAHSYKNKFGVWPKGMKDDALPPNQSTLNWLRSRQIAFAKSKKVA